MIPVELLKGDAMVQSATASSGLGLLFDVDGPLASPLSRTVRINSILDDLVMLAASGVPIAFITGRSDAFIRDQVVAPLRAAGLDAALRMPGARMFGVFEKGATWAPITSDGMGEVDIDTSVALPADFVSDVRLLVSREYSSTMFFDETKRAMVSVEQRTDVAASDYLPEQHRFNRAVFDLATWHGLGVRFGDAESADVNGEIPFRLDPTIISTDVESVALDKDRGAERALAYFASLGPLPSVWRSAGDSRSDYLMADHLHAAGFEVAHLDVRPADGVLDRPYPVLTEGDLIHDEAGAQFLRNWVDALGLVAA
jgi:hypothetical protein